MYRMLHDIYSLGVCLLEVGECESFVEYTDESELSGAPRSSFGEAYHSFQAWLKVNKGAASGAREGADLFQSSLAFGLKDYLVELALSRPAGPYAGVV